MENQTPWQAAVQSAKGTGPTKDRDGRRAIRILPKNEIAKEDPTAEDRSFSLVDEVLQRAFRDLVLGCSAWPLLLWGPTGTGKTLASRCLTDFSPDAAFFHAKKLADTGWDADSFIWHRVRECELLVVDEIGSECGSINYTAPRVAMERVADLRESHAGRVAIYITNHDPEELADMYGDRTASRMMCGTIFHLDGCDRRFTEQS